MGTDEPKGPPLSQLLCFLEDALPIFQPQSAINDEDSILTDDKTHVGHQVDALVRNHRDF